MIQFLSWDTTLFGYKVGEINSQNQLISNLLAQAKAENYRLLYARLSPENIEQHLIYLQYSGKLVDEKIIFWRQIPENQLLNNNPSEIYEDNFSTEELTQLALESGTYSRFKLDTAFKNQEFEKLYTVWLENSVKKQIAEKVIIQKIQNKIVGVLTLGIKNLRADIGILAVNLQYRRLGIASHLVHKALIESQLLEQNIIQVATQKANQNACKFYQKMGFEIEKIENIYHFWI